MKFQTQVRGYAAAVVTFEADNLEAAKELIESGEGAANFGASADWAARRSS
jgi:hypothetical protein